MCYCKVALQFTLVCSRVYLLFIFIYSAELRVHVYRYSGVSALFLFVQYDNEQYEVVVRGARCLCACVHNVLEYE